MFNKNSFMERFPDVSEGMKVRSRDGENLGKIDFLDEDSFTVQKGFFFPRDFTFRYDDVEDVRDGEVIMNILGSELADWRKEDYSGWAQIEDINAGKLEAAPRDEYRDRYQPRGTEETRIPVVEEELQATKTVREAGEVRIRKVAHSELKHFTIPVMKEELKIERVPAEGASAAGTEGAFEDKTVTIPLREEEVQVTKTPVVKEEVRVSREQKIEEREVSGEVRKEEVKIETPEEEERRKAV